MHEGQIAITVEQVRRLLADQYPQLATETITAVIPGGTVNSTFRIGNRVGARFPLGPGNPRDIWMRLNAEQQAASTLVRLTRFATPVPLGIGDPDENYPYPWALQSWVPGQTADHVDYSESEGLAADLAEFITAVRRLDSSGQQFSGRGRGGTLADHDDQMSECIANAAHLFDAGQLTEIWEQLRTLPRGDEPDVMCHQDLIPGNLVVRYGRLVGVIDVGDLGPADPALDLICAWHLFGRRTRDVLRDALDCTEAQWSRGRAWAFVQAVPLTYYYETSNPPMSRLGVRTVKRIVTELTG